MRCEKCGRDWTHYPNAHEQYCGYWATRCQDCIFGTGEFEARTATADCLACLLTGAEPIPMSEFD